MSALETIAKAAVLTVDATGGAAITALAVQYHVQGWLERSRSRRHGWGIATSRGQERPFGAQVVLGREAEYAAAMEAWSTSGCPMPPGPECADGHPVIPAASLRALLHLPTPTPVCRWGHPAAVPSLVALPAADRAEPVGAAA